MNFTDFYGISPSSSTSDSWTEFQVPGIATPMEQAYVPSFVPCPTFSDTNLSLLNHIPSSSDAPLPAPALPPLLDISLNRGTAAAASGPHPAASNPPHKKARLTYHGAPKPKERELDPEEDIPTTAANVMVRCRWGTCEETFCAGAWTAHAKRHRTAMQATRDRAGHAKCLWKGCGARLKPGSMGKHVRAQHVGTYEVRCKHCGKTARADSYVETHGLARDCPLRPGPSPASTMASASMPATPALSPSRASSMSTDTDTLPGPSCYSRCRLSDTSFASPEPSNDRAPSVLPLLAKSLRDRRQQDPARDVPPEVLAAKPIPTATTATDAAQPLVLFHPRPARLYQPLGFDLSTPPPPLVPDVPESFEDTPANLHMEWSHPEDSSAPSSWQPFALTADALAPDADVSFCLLVAGMPCLDASFTFDSSAVW